MDDNGMPGRWSDLPDHEREEFIDYLGVQIQNVMTAAERDGQLFDLITNWSKRKIIAYQLAVIVANQISEEDN